MTEPRREFLGRIARAAGVAPAVMALLDGTARALPAGLAPDLEILHAALTLEHHAIALYDECLRHRLLGAEWRTWAVEFRGDHLGHRDTQVALSRQRGGRPPDPPSRPALDLREGRDALRQLHEIERAAGDAYAALLGRIRTDDYLLSAGFILVDEARHLTVWSHALGLRIY